MVAANVNEPRRWPRVPGCTGCRRSGRARHVASPAANAAAKSPANSRRRLHRSVGLDAVHESVCAVSLNSASRARPEQQIKDDRPDDGPKDPGDGRVRGLPLKNALMNSHRHFVLSSPIQRLSLVVGRWQRSFGGGDLMKPATGKALDHLKATSFSLGWRVVRG